MLFIVRVSAELLTCGKMFLKLQFPSSSLRQNWRNMGGSSIYIEFTRPQINVQCSLHYTAARAEDQDNNQVWVIEVKCL